MSTVPINWTPCLNCACAVDPSKWKKHNAVCPGMAQLKSELVDRIIESTRNEIGEY